MCSCSKVRMASRKENTEIPIAWYMLSSALDGGERRGNGTLEAGNPGRDSN